MLDMKLIAKHGLRCLLRVGLPAAAFYAAAVVILKLSGLGLLDIIRDPAQTLESSSFIGFTSNIGTWFWVSATAISAFTFGRASPDHRGLLILLGTLSGLLAVDDFFLIHDRYVNQYLCYAIYALFAALIWIRHHRLIIEINLAAFILAGAWLALSIFTDVVQYHLPGPYQYNQAFEEGFKFMGGATWLYFCATVAAHALQPMGSEQ